MRCFSSVVLTALVTLTCVTALAIPDVLLDESDFEALNATLGPRSLEKRWDGVFSTCQQPGQFALTFDDGPHGYGAEITQFLNSKGVKATFFVNGNNYGCIYDRAEELQARFKAGHQIASHTWSHPNLAGLTDAQVNRQLALLETALQKILGVKPAMLRPPHGSYKASQVPLFKSRGYTTMIWNLDSGDTSGRTAQQQIDAFRWAEAQYPKPFMTLQHEPQAITARQVVPVIVPRLLAKGYKLVTAAQCLGRAAYQGSPGSLGKRDSSWTCAGLPGPGKT